MRRTKCLLQISVAVVVLATTSVAGVPKYGRADAANGPSLVISQLKVTSSNGQFVTLYNATDTVLDMSHYQLEYFNNYDLGKATSSKLIALSGMVPPHGYFMVNDDSLLLCYQVTVDSVSLDFSSTAGFVEVLASEQSGPGGAITPVLQDYTGWSKTAANGAQTLPSNTSAFLRRQPTDAGNNPALSLPGAGTWQTVQPDSNNACNLVTASGASVGTPSGLGQLLPASDAPSTILAADVAGGQPAPSMPAADIGLMAPAVNELLPNPVGTGNDNTDEFIELYNPNPKAFDLTSFGLQIGSTTLHTYTFPSGTTLPANSFTAFYSVTTKLGLSNTSGQAKLLDPFGNSISASSTYDTAKDGVAWAAAKGKWYWTTQPTPGKANIIKKPPVTTKKSTSKKNASKVSGASDIKHIKTTNAASTASYGSGDASFTPVHPWTLAIIGGLALLYGAYEYRADVANYFHQLRRHASARRKSGA